MGALGLYGVYSIMCGLLLLGYIGMMVKHRRYILLLQYCTLGVIIVALAEVTPRTRLLGHLVLAHRCILTAAALVCYCCGCVCFYLLRFLRV